MSGANEAKQKYSKKFIETALNDYRRETRQGGDFYGEY